MGHHSKGLSLEIMTKIVDFRFSTPEVNPGPRKLGTSGQNESRQPVGRLGSNLVEMFADKQEASPEIFKSIGWV